MNEINLLKMELSAKEAYLKQLELYTNKTEQEITELRRRLDETVVDGLRLKVREFIASVEAPVFLKLKRCEHIKWKNRTPYLEDRSVSYSWKFLNLTEEEAILLSSKDGRQAYNIDCSVWDTYKYPGEIN